jgi:hypothetical protein
MPNVIPPTNGLAERNDAARNRAERLDPAAPVGDGNDPAGTTGADRTVAVTEVRAHIGIHRCRRVLVTVNFAGERIERRFVPTATIQAVRRWAVGIHGFDLSAEQQPEHEVSVCNTGVVADRKTRVGALAIRCTLCLDLARRDRFNS